MTVSAAENPDLANALAAAALSSGGGRTDPPIIEVPPDPFVTLPGGLFDPLSGDSLTAEVRELNGEDEESIARSGTNLVKTVDAILNRGVVSVGDKTASKTLLGSMLAGDRDFLLVQIRIATFGNDIELTLPECPHCRHADIDLVVELDKDVPVSTLDSPSDARFDMTLPSGKRAEVRLPDGETQRALAEDGATIARMNTIMLARCVRTLDGMPVVGDSQVRALGLRDREALLTEINKRNCGPRLAEVTKACPQCGEDIPLPLSLAALFRL